MSKDKLIGIYSVRVLLICPEASIAQRVVICRLIWGEAVHQYHLGGVDLSGVDQLLFQELPPLSLLPQPLLLCFFVWVFSGVFDGDGLLLLPGCACAGVLVEHFLYAFHLEAAVASSSGGRVVRDLQFHLRKSIELSAGVQRRIVEGFEGGILAEVVRAFFRIGFLLLLWLVGLILDQKLDHIVELAQFGRAHVFELLVQVVA